MYHSIKSKKMGVVSKVSVQISVNGYLMNNTLEINGLICKI